MSSNDEQQQDQAPQNFTLEVHDVENDDETTDPTEEVDTNGQTDVNR